MQLILSCTIFAVGLGRNAWLRPGTHKKVTMMIDDRLKLNAKSKFAMYMETQNMRKTPERFAILEMAMSFGEHFSADELYRRMEEDSYHVSRATIYNTLDLLTDCGILRRHQFGSNQSQYECMAETLNHHHLICTECGKIKEIKDTELIKYMNTKRYPAFTASYYVLYIYGVCNACARRAKRKMNTNKKI